MPPSRSARPAFTTSACAVFMFSPPQATASPQPHGSHHAARAWPRRVGRVSNQSSQRSSRWQCLDAGRGNLAVRWAYLTLALRVGRIERDKHPRFGQIAFDPSAKIGPLGGSRRMPSMRAFVSVRASEAYSLFAIEGFTGSMLEPKHCGSSSMPPSCVLADAPIYWVDCVNASRYVVCVGIRSDATSVGFKRESGVTPELPRSGRAETNAPTCTGPLRLGSGSK